MNCYLMRIVTVKFIVIRELLKPILKNHNGIFISRARLAFAKLRWIFDIVMILHGFDLKCHIWIEINVFSYAIDEMFS